MTAMEDFKGYISDLGGPSANMYGMGGYDKSICANCKRPSCLHPTPCRNLDNDHRPLLDIYRSVNELPEVKKAFVGSGVRYDLAMAPNRSKEVNKANEDYIEELIRSHVSGRLKVAPEHTSPQVLDCMRKPSFDLFRQFKHKFDEINNKEGLRQQIIPYFISSHPACKEADMAELAAITKGLDFHLEQVQDFTPTPMTLASEIYYTGIHPYTGKDIFTARTEKEKLAQRQFFFWYKPENQRQIVEELRKIGRPDLIRALYPGGIRMQQESRSDARRSHIKENLKEDRKSKGHSTVKGKISRKKR